jgi:plastocyanin
LAWNERCAHDLSKFDRAVVALKKNGTRLFFAGIRADCRQAFDGSLVQYLLAVEQDGYIPPDQSNAKIGDEIRWVNQRSTPVTVEFLGDALAAVTCQSGFSNFLRRQQEVATIDPNESASLCFGIPGTVTYNARMDSPVSGGQTIESGTIQVGQVASAQ